jgi:predicted amidohydrolase
VTNPLTVAAAQPAYADLDVDTSVQRHARLVRAARAQLVVFPELSLTGYVMTAPVVRPDDPRLAPLVSACRDTGAVALVGAPVADLDGAESIAVLAVNGEGVTVAYRKIWLHGDAETSRFTPGGAPVAVEVGGWRLGLAVCADVGVPEHARVTAGLGIDAYVASSLYRDSAEALRRRDTHLAERAKAYGVWGIRATGAGPTGEFGPGSGGSGIWAPDGSMVVQAGRTPGEMVRAILDPVR